MIALELARIGLTWTDVAEMTRDLLVAIARSNRDLLEEMCPG